MKRLFFLILSLFVSLIATSCNKGKESDPTIKGTTQDYLLTVLFMDRMDNNLLNAANFSALKMSYIVDGKEVEALFPHLHLDNPRLVSMVHREYGTSGLQNMLTLPINTLDKGKITTTILDWGYETDTVQAEIDRKPGVVQVVKVWWNDELVWDFEIAKQQYEDSVRVSSRFVKLVK